MQIQNIATVFLLQKQQNSAWHFTWGISPGLAFYLHLLAGVVQSFPLESGHGPVETSGKAL